MTIHHYPFFDIWGREMLVNKCYLKDIRDYEENTNSNILRLFDKISIHNLVTLLMIFNKNLSKDDAYVMIDMYVDIENKTILDAFTEIRNALIGYEYRELNEDETKDIEGTADDINTYKTLTDFYMHLCMQLMSLGVTYTEFWSLTTKEMYQVFQAIEQKIILDFNRQMQLAHITSQMDAAAIWGKPLKEAPQINSDRTNNNDEEVIINHAKYGNISLADLKNIQALEKLN